MLYKFKTFKQLLCSIFMCSFRVINQFTPLLIFCFITVALIIFCFLAMLWMKRKKSRDQVEILNMYTKNILISIKSKYHIFKRAIVSKEDMPENTYLKKLHKFLTSRVF